jgi:POT family proton-dependent oligopeptide transporter
MIIALGLWAVTAVILLVLMDDFLFGMAIGLFVGFIAMIIQISTKEELPKTGSLILVFVVVVFFWMSFHQNGLTLTYFARDYTVKEVAPFNNVFFNLNSILAFIGAAAGLYILAARKKATERVAGAVMFLGLGYLTYRFITGYEPLNPIAPEIFQSFNPLFIVVLTFPVMGVFAWLRSKNAEPSTPRKIGIGMIIAAFGFIIVMFGSRGLVSPHDVTEQGLTEWDRISPQWLISTYLILTVAELFLSPMGLSFVSKVAPSRFQGLMQGGWLLATATGNKLLFVGSFFWDKIQLWQLWLIFVVCCLASAAFIFSILKRLENATK